MERRFSLAYSRFLKKELGMSFASAWLSMGDSDWFWIYIFICFLLIVYISFNVYRDFLVVQEIKCRLQRDLATSGGTQTTNGPIVLGSVSSSV